MALPDTIEEILNASPDLAPTRNFYLEQPGRHLRAWWDSMSRDHTWLRFPWSVKRPVSPAQNMFRAGQPNRARLTRYKAQGIKTVINLRGLRDDGTYALEAEACKDLDLRLVNFAIGSREPPRVQLIMHARELYQRIEYPALLHCKAGADRAGLMSTLYLIFQEGMPVEEAQKKALSWRYGHIRHGKTGVLDHFFETYTAYNAQKPIDFVEWVQTVYDRDAMAQAFKAGRMAELLETMLRRE